MNRRDAVRALLVLGAAGRPLAAFAQQPGKVWRIGMLSVAAGPGGSADPLREQLHKLGYVEGRNLLIESRWAAGNNERLQELAAELVRLKVDVIVTQATIAALAAKRATSTIPIVMAASADPVGAGIVASLSRPGGNVTGVTANSPEVAGKRLQLLLEVVPKAKRVAVLIWRDSITKLLALEQTRAAAKQLGITLVVQEVDAPGALAGAFAAMQRERAQALIVPTSPFANSNSKMIMDLAVQHRLPAMFDARGTYPGGLIAYGANSAELRRRGAHYVDRIFKGDKPADLPIEQPTRYELSIDLKAAKAIGIAIPQSVLTQADEVIK